MAHEGLVSLPSFASFPFFSMFQSSWKVSTVFMSRWLRGKKYLIDLTGALVASGRTSFAASRTEVPNVCDLPLVIFVGAFYRWIVFVSGKKNIEFFVKQFFMFEERMYFLSDSRIARSTSMAFRTCRLAVKREKIPQPLCVCFFLLNSPYVKSKGLFNKFHWMKVTRVSSGKPYYVLTPICGGLCRVCSRNLLPQCRGLGC